MVNDVRDNLPQLRDALRALPGIVQHLGEQVSSGRVNFNLQSPELREIQEQMAEQRTQRYWLTAAATAVVCGALVMVLGSMPVLAWSLLGVGAIAAYVARP